MKMKSGRPKSPLALTPDEVTQLRSLVASRSIPNGLAARARMIRLSHAGLSNTAIAQKLSVAKATVGKWRQRFVTDRLAGLHDELRPGRPRTHTDEKIATLVRKTLRTKPKATTHGSCRTLAGATGISKSTVHRVWQVFGLQPHRQRTFKPSTDPFFIEKVRDIVGLYLNPPDKALVLCVDEKTQVQALNRTQPLLPLGMGSVEGATHDSGRHGTTTLFAALDVATGTVLSQCRGRHRPQEFLGFLRHIEANVPPDPGCPSHHRSLCDAQTSQGPAVVGSTPPLPCALHADLCVLAQSGGTLVPSNLPTGHSSWLLPECQRVGRQD